MSVYGLHSVHAHISISRLPTCPGKKWKKNFPVNGLRTEEQSKTEQNKTKQNKTKQKKIPMELESIKVKFHWKKQSQTKQPLELNRAFNIFDLEN